MDLISNKDTSQAHNVQVNPIATAFATDSFMPREDVGADAAAAGQAPKALSQICDLIALTSALIATMSSAPFLAFDFDQLARADERWVKTTDGSGSMTPVSDGIATYSTILLSMGGFALFSAIVSRGILCFHESLDSVRQQTELVLSVTPLIFLSAVALFATIIMLPFPIYYAGWVVFPAHIVDAPSYKWMGAWLIVASSCLLLYFICVAIYLAYFRDATFFERCAQRVTVFVHMIMRQASIVGFTANRTPVKNSHRFNSEPVASGENR